MPEQRPIIVQKYGGSSVADVERIGKIADKVVATKEAGNDVVVAVSAMGKTTDGLLALAKQAASVGGEERTVARRELDMLVSTGERVTMSLLSIAVQARGHEAISFTGSQSGILTNDRHFDARIIEVRPVRIEDELHRGRIVIVAGYQGMSYKREITTLGRGGTDTTAVALAAALGATQCEIYSDVDGVYSADPRHVKGARHLPEIDPELLQELAESGAKVLCAQAVSWARKKGIAIVARSTFDDRPTPRETVVRKDLPTGRLARAVASDPVVARVRVRPELRAALLTVVDHESLSAQSWSSSSDRFEVVLSLTHAPAPSEVIERLRSELSADVDEQLACVSLVGDGLGTPELLTQVMAALGDCGPVLAAHGSALRISALVPADRTTDAVRALHEAFVER